MILSGPTLRENAQMAIHEEHLYQGITADLSGKTAEAVLHYNAYRLFPAYLRQGSAEAEHFVVWRLQMLGAKP